MIHSDCITVALAFCMVVFPAFVILPSAFALYKRIAEYGYTFLHIVSFTIAGLSLLVATVFADIGLFSLCSVVGFSLGILISLITIAILIFLPKLQQWLWELALLEEFNLAEATE